MEDPHEPSFRRGFQKPIQDDLPTGSVFVDTR
jgi:hypothetical protein